MRAPVSKPTVEKAVLYLSDGTEVHAYPPMSDGGRWLVTEPDTSVPCGRKGAFRRLEGALAVLRRYMERTA